MKKKYILLIFSLPLLFINIASVSATHFSVEVTDNDSASGGGNCIENAQKTAEGEGGCYASGCCVESQSFRTWSEVEVSAYDMYNNKIDLEKVNGQDKILAGTYVRLSAYERKGYESITTYYSYSAKLVCTCTYWYYEQGCSDDDLNGDGIVEKPCTPKYGTATRDCQCNGPTDTGGTCKWVEIGGNAGSCASSISPGTKDLTASYTVEFSDSNDASNTCNPETDEYCTKHTMSPSSQSCTKTDEKDDGAGTTIGGEECYFYYDRGETYIDVKTGKVRYPKEDQVLGTELLPNEYKIFSESKHWWKYFIPLNANSLDGFSISLSTNKNIQEESLCKEIIKKYDTYPYLILDNKGQQFTPITIDMKPNQIEQKKNQDMKKVEGGCYYQTIIRIPVEQKFYNETTNNNTTKFQGFNFYYKPIDINNPFPNGMNNTSIWYDWSKSSDKNPNLEKSYNEKRYYTENLNANSIRIYNSQNLYTDWSKMNLDGTSQFIDDYTFMNRDESLFTYKLGCGPANENKYINEIEKIANPLYQEECGNS